MKEKRAALCPPLLNSKDMGVGKDDLTDSNGGGGCRSGQKRTQRMTVFVDDESEVRPLYDVSLKYAMRLLKKATVFC